MEITKNARTVLERRYLIRDDQGPVSYTHLRAHET